MSTYQTLESVREIMLIDADSYHAELYRGENAHWGIEPARGAEDALYLTSSDLRIPMSELYEGIAIPASNLR